MKYIEKLKHPKWQKKRLEILSRDKFCCTCCGNENNSLQIHHDKYEGEFPWQTRDEYLRTVCFKCHSILEFMKKGIFITGNTVSLKAVVKYASDKFAVVNFNYMNRHTQTIEFHSMVLLFKPYIEMVLITDRDHWNRISQGILVEDEING